MSETFTTYGIGPDKQFDELQALRDERDRLKRALEEIAMGTIAWERDEMIDCALAALTPAGEGRMSEMPRFDNDIEQLKSFYDVTNEKDLIVAMDKHIVRLQNKIRQLLPPEPAVRQVRA